MDHIVNRTKRQNDQGTGTAAEQIPSLAGAAWLIRAETQAVLAALNQDGEETRIVGGAIRNALMGRPVIDIDMATTAPPEKASALAERAGLRAVPTGLAHGTITVIAAHHPYEVTTLRRDVETFGRHATIAFTRCWREDAERRDFTMNALYADAEGTIFDPLGGYPDLRAQKVRFIGEPVTRIREDYLRILRFFRFNAEYGANGLDEAGYLACIRERAGLETLSAERVRVELLRLLGARRAAPAVQAMDEAGLLLSVLGGVPARIVFERLIGIEAGLGQPADALLRLGALALRVEEDAVRIAARLRLSGAERRRLMVMAAGNSQCPALAAEITEVSARVVLYRLGARGFCDRVMLAWARSGTPAGDEDWCALLDLPRRWQAPEFPLRGADLIALGAVRGPEIGRILRKLEADWIDSDFTLERVQLLELAHAELAQPEP